MDAHALTRDGWPCPTGEEMGRIDRDAIEVRGLPGRLLMENAGRAVAQAVRELAPETRRPPVLCGAGNNGGDGFVIARVLAEWDAACRPIVLALGDPERRSDEARENFELLWSSGVEVVLPQELKELEGLLARCDLVIDAVFGVGLARAVEGELARLFEAVSRAAPRVLAVDLPSGTASDSGAPLGRALEADWIVTLGLPKLGLALRPLAAPILVADIGLPAVSLAAVSVQQHCWTRAAAARRLPPRPADAHKGTFGHVLVVAGSRGKTGAGVLAAEGALGAGAGLVTVAAPAELHDVFETKLTEAMSLPLPDGGRALLGTEATGLVAREAAARDVVAIGPGLGQDGETKAAVRTLLAGLERPAVVDADALNACAGEPEAAGRAGPRVLTPHPGEMARLLSCTTARVADDRVGAAREAARRSGAVVLLKGARTIVARPDGAVRINPTGGPGLASGGSGDVLTGVIAAFLAQGVDPFDAAALAAFVHGLAGERGGPIGLAGALASGLPATLAELRLASPESSHDLLRRFP